MIELGLPGNVSPLGALLTAVDVHCSGISMKEKQKSYFYFIKRFVRNFAGQNALIIQLTETLISYEMPMNVTPIHPDWRFFTKSHLYWQCTSSVKMVSFSLWDAFAEIPTLEVPLKPYKWPTWWSIFSAYSDAQLIKVLRRCGLANSHDDEEAALALLSTEVGESGRALSAGQRQLLYLARALFQQAPGRRSVICLDEVTASLDEACEEKIQVGIWYVDQYRLIGLFYQHGPNRLGKIRAK